MEYKMKTDMLGTAQELRKLAATGAKNGEMKRASELISILERKGCLTEEFYKRDDNDVLRFKAGYGKKEMTREQFTLHLAAVALEESANGKAEMKGPLLPAKTRSPFYTQMLGY